jgi:hypothetical protein
VHDRIFQCLTAAPSGVAPYPPRVTNRKDPTGMGKRDQESESRQVIELC